MINAEVAKKIKHIEIIARRLLSGSMAGDSRSAIKGSGLEFDQIREYQIGDDVRFIDWNSSARMNTLLVKQYIEERSRTIYVAVDISASSFFGSSAELKSDVMAQLASLLSLVAHYGKDKVGLILFSDEIKKVIPPALGMNHVRVIMQMLFTLELQKNARTNVGVAFEYLAKLKQRDIVAFVLSDFISSNFETPLAAAAYRHEIIAIVCRDKVETQFPNVGFIQMSDVETHASHVFDTRRAKHINAMIHDEYQSKLKALKRRGADILELCPQQEFMGSVIRFFRRRMRY